ncbi:hypothetical protein [Bradyrhizobium erythrophlei]|uniref:Uncharacterized protein n=1 Tax=Bradyrhizobium erythrophlei TaxID=1437360 RepID=A0A1H4NLK3_9BRAD|nr:hypothetical protein [Bradyrhizobium erythrophlei]SEB95815.1 hypothetical protein SAMN05444164_0659 [Bradyrhizobium erythrophlei]
MNEIIDNENIDSSDTAGMLVTTAGGMNAVARAEIDMQISTARAYPRRPSQVRKALVELVTLDDAAAEEAMYALPRAGKPVTGPSIRFAEAVKQAWGNCRASVEVSEVNKELKYVEAVGIFHDLETNTVTRIPHRRRISGRNGKLFPDDMIMVTSNAASSVAMREAILKGVPKPVWRAAYEAVVKVISGDVMTLAENREKAIKAFAIYGVKPEQVFAAIGVLGADDITLEHITVMRGMFSALKNGEETVESMFAKRERETDPNFNPLVKKDAGGADQQTVVGANDAAAAADQSSAEKPGKDSAAAEAAHPSGHAAGHQPAARSDSAATPAQASAKPAPADAGTSQERTASGSSQPDLLSGTAPAAGGKPQPSESPTSSAADGADATRGNGAASAPDQLRSYHKALATIENGGPPKVGKMSHAWYEKNGKDGAFDDAGQKKAQAIYAVHVKRVTGEVTAADCTKQVEEIIAR